MAALTPDVLLAGVDLRAWAPLLDCDEIDAALKAIGDPAELAPPPHLIFEALRYAKPPDIHTVVIGQDPYPTPGDAQGLSFSVPKGRAIPESLKRVLGCLEKQGLRKASGGANGDLRPWAVQGVLLLNAALTTRVGDRTRPHAAAWRPFVTEFLRRLCARAEKPLYFLLWGGDARGFAGLVEEAERGHLVCEWSHPSPMADNKLVEAAKFANCPHFGFVNRRLQASGRRPVVWDNGAPVVAFSDGSCPLNGKPGARASFAAVLTGGQFGAAVVRGEVAPYEYEFVDPTAPGKGVRATKKPATPSNNRGELLGVVHCLLAGLRGCALGHFELVSDSNITVQTLLDWLPARMAKGTAHELKNYDLVMIAWRLLGELRERAAVTLSHIRSHQPQPPASAPVRERFRWKGNDAADRHAEAVLANDAIAGGAREPRYTVETVNAPAVLCVD